MVDNVSRYISTHLSALKKGIKQEQVKNNALQNSFFDKIDKDNNQELNETEANRLANAIELDPSKEKDKKHMEQASQFSQTPPEQVEAVLLLQGDSIPELVVVTKPAEDGTVLIKTLTGGDGNNPPKLTEERAIKDNIETITKFNEDGTKSVTKGAITKTFDAQDRVIKVETDKGSGVTEASEYQYEGDSKVPNKEVKTAADGTKTEVTENVPNPNEEAPAPKVSEPTQKTVTPPPAKDANPPQKNVTPPAQDTNPPAKTEESQVQALLVKSEENAGKEVANSDGTVTQYDKNGYVSRILDSNKNPILHVERNDDGSLKGFTELKNNSDGNTIRKIDRDKDGNVTKYSDFEYDESGKPTRTINRSPDGKVISTSEWEIDDKGRTTSQIARNANGDATVHIILEYEGDSTTPERINYYDADGNLISFQVPDENGNLVSYKPDGTKIEDETTVDRPIDEPSQTPSAPPTEEPSAPVSHDGPVYAKEGETFLATAKRIFGDENLTKDDPRYKALAEANPKDAKRNWFRLGAEIKIPDSVKDKLADAAFGVDKAAEEKQYVDKAVGNANTEKYNDDNTEVKTLDKSTSWWMLAKENLQATGVQNPTYAQIYERIGELVKLNEGKEPVKGTEIKMPKVAVNNPPAAEPPADAPTDTPSAPPADAPTDTPSAPPADAPTDTPSAPPAGGDNNGSEVTKESCRATEVEGIYYNETTKTHYVEKDGKMVEYKPEWLPEGEKIVQVNKDGTCVSEFKSDSGTIHHSVYDKEGRETRRNLGSSSERFIYNNRYFVFDYSKTPARYTYWENNKPIESGIQNEDGSWVAKRDHVKGKDV